MHPLFLVTVVTRAACIALFALTLAGIFFPQRTAAQSDPVLQAARLPGGEIEVSWNAAPGLRLESSVTVGPTANWQTAPEAVQQSGNRVFVVLAPSGQTRFLRLTSGGGLVTILETSPSPGETGVAITREAILRLSGPLGPNSVVTPAHLRATAAGKSILSRVEVSSDRRTVSLFHLEPLPAAARVRVEFTGDGLLDSAGQPIDPDGDGAPGGTAAFDFVTSGTAGLTGTAVIGYVFASERNPDGSNKPLANVTITVDGAEEQLRTVTDASGFFRLEPAPAGRFFVHVDGRTAIGSQWPDGAYYPFVGKAWEAVAGRTNNLAGGTGEVFLPLIPADALTPVSATSETVIGFPPSVTATNPALAGVLIRVPPDALFSDNGLRGGRVGLAPVPPDRLPEPLPPGLNFPIVITIQTDGPLNFDRPVPVRFPNLPDPVTGEKLPPGAKTTLWSFNHDNGRWEPQGSMTISADGQYAETDPGVGIRQPGWHGGIPGSGGSGPGKNRRGDDDDDHDDGPNCPNGTPPACCEPGGWDKLKDQCDQQRELALNAIFDFAVDGVDFLLEALPGGCLASGMFETTKTARDCAVVGQFTDECADIASDNGIGFGLSCIPVVGGVLDLGWSGKQLTDNVFNFKGCLDNIKSVCGFAQALAQLQSRERPAADTVTLDPRVERAISALELQIELAEASSNLLARLYGSPVWSRASSAEDNQRLQAFLSALSDALAPGSPDGNTANAAERTALLALPLPSGATQNDATQLIDRIQGFAGGSLKTDTATRNILIQAFDEYLEVLQRAIDDGWTDPFDGFREAIAALTSMYNPDHAPVGGTTASSSPALHASTNDSEPPVFPSGAHFYLLRDHTTGFVRRGRLNQQGRFEGIILRPDTMYSISYLDPVAMVGGAAFFRSAGPGEETIIPTALLRPLTGSSELAAQWPDSDLDGLPDIAEGILGTSAERADTDGDGLRDAQEIAAGTDPLDGIGLPTGTIAVAATPGIPEDIAASMGLAVVASQGGLGVFDVSNPRDPVLIATVPGFASSVALREREALAGFLNDVRLLDLSDPTTPVQRWIRDDLRSAQAVAFGLETGFALVNDRLHEFDLTTGAATRSVQLPLPCDDIAVHGDVVYARAGDTLVVVDRSDLSLRIERRLDMPGSGGVGRRRLRITTTESLLYGHHTQGVGVLDLREPLQPELLVSQNTLSAGWRQIVPTGNGTALAIVGPNSTDDGPHDVSVYDLGSSGTNLQFVASFAMPGSAVALAMAGARAFVVDDTAGLLVVNYLEPDLGTSPPSIALSVKDSTTPQPVEAESLVRISARTSDDVAVRDVAFFVNGERVAGDDSYPFEFLLRAPAITPANPSPVLTIRARATDTAGNSAESAEFILPVVADATPPQIVAVDPPQGAAIVPNLLSEIRAFLDEPLAGPIDADTLQVLHSGPDLQLDTPDDAMVAGTVTAEDAGATILFRANAPLTNGVYRVTLAAGVSDAAGNARVRPSPWEFRTGPTPYAQTIFPIGSIVRVGGTVDEIRAIFDQPLPKLFSDTYAWQLARFNPDNTLSEIAPLQVTLAADARTYTLRPPAPLGAGIYQVSGSGPNVVPAQWSFALRTEPNELLDVVNGSPVWKYPPGPASNDVLIINVPGTIANIGGQTLKRVIAQSDIRISGDFSVVDPVDVTGALWFTRNVTLAPGETHARGPVWMLEATSSSLRFRAHTLHVHGGGELTGGLSFDDPSGSLLNHPGSTLVLSNTFRVSGSSALTNPVGSIINLGTLQRRGGTNIVRIEGPRLRNDGRIELTEGGLLVQYLENEGEIELGAESRLILRSRTRGGINSRITGVGAVEFGEWDAPRFRLLSAADAEIRGVFNPTGPLHVHGGSVTLWQPLQSPELIELREAALLQLIAPARLGPVRINGGVIRFNSDAEVASAEISAGGGIEAATLARVTGDAHLRNATFSGGVVEFSGSTIVSNGTQQAFVRVRDGWVRNTGVWKMDFGSQSGGEFDRAGGGQSGEHGFENAGEFEWISVNPLVVRIPFRNAGRARFGPGIVAFDARNQRTGAYRPVAGAVLTLQDTRIEYHWAGILDLAAGTLEGTGFIQNVSATDDTGVINRGVLRVGLPTGTLTIISGGGLELTETSTLIMTIGADASSRLESRNGAPAFKLGGTLRIEAPQGFRPEIGTTFELLTVTSVGAGDIEGAFASVELPDLGPDRRLRIDAEPRRVVATVVAP